MGSLQSPTNSGTPALSPGASLQPTWSGYVSETRDALILFEATISGQLNRVVRRPHDRERSSLIISGSIFIYEESASGIKRWTDGVPWSPSRILNNFLIYRELEKPFPPGEKKRAAKKLKRTSSRPGEPYPRGDGSKETSPTNPGTPPMKFDSNTDKDSERSLVGSLTDSYAFKENGLVKKTMSVVVEGVSYHLVSYYNPDDVKQGLLQTPGESSLNRIRPRSELLHRQNFRAPLDDVEEPPLPGAFSIPPRDAYIHAPTYMASQSYLPSYGSPMHQYQMQMQHHHPQIFQQEQRGYAPSSASQQQQQQQQAYYSGLSPSQIPPPPQYGTYAPYQDPRNQYSQQDPYSNTPTTNGWSGHPGG